MVMKEHIDTIKIVFVAMSGSLLKFTEALGDIASPIGAIAAATYAVYKLYILHRDNVNKEK